MRRIALATWEKAMPHEAAENALVLRALAAEGLEPELLPWRAGDLDAGRFDALLIRTPWDYTDDAEAFLAWTERAARRVPVANPPELLRWNADKTYLLDLARSGISIPPTIHVRAGTSPDLADLLAREGWDRYVVKPTIDAGARRAMRATTDDLPRAIAHLEGILRDRDAFVQPYLPSIESVGEISLVHFDGAFSHAVRKTPAAGDWRIQAQHGGRSEAAEPTPAERALAARAIAALPAAPLYARVDLVALEDGAPAVIEVEVIEPFLFLATEEGAATRYARAVAGWVDRATTTRAGA